MPRPSQCVVCLCYEACFEPDNPQCAERPAPAETEQQRTWHERDEAAKAVNTALERLTAAQRVVRARQAEYLAASKAAEQAVAADISAHRGYPCDHFGNPLAGDSPQTTEGR